LPLAVVPLLYSVLTFAHPAVPQVTVVGIVACLNATRTRSMSPVEWVGSVTVWVVALAATQEPAVWSEIAMRWPC
jgi:xanthosine utilization system XapX-like protein